MKKRDKGEKIHTGKIPKKPTNFHEVKEDLMSNKLTDTQTVTVGINRGQLFIRLPTRMVERLKLNKGDEMRIVMTGSEKDIEVSLEKVESDA